jgi:hypothetical protein
MTIDWTQFERELARPARVMRDGNLWREFGAPAPHPVPGLWLGTLLDREMRRSIDFDDFKERARG